MVKWKRYGSEIVSGPTYDSAARSITIKILEGMTFEQAGVELGIKASSVHKKFRLTAASLFMPSQRNEIIEKNHDISFLRELWQKTQAAELMKF